MKLKLIENKLDADDLNKRDDEKAFNVLLLLLGSSLRHYEPFHIDNGIYSGKIKLKGMNLLVHY